MEVMNLPGTGLPGHGVELSTEQQDGVTEIGTCSKRVRILTGQAGSGKSTIINHLRNTGLWTACATTGKAAMHIQGVTVDSLFCINRERWNIWSEDYLSHVMTNIPDNIIIDEASMVGERMGDLIIQIAEQYEKQILLVGDWAQASPVKDGLILDSGLLEDYHFIKLMENHRQGDQEMVEVLNKLRLGEVDQQVTDLMKGRVCVNPPDDDTCLRMYGTNRKTDAYNNMRLWQHVSQQKCGHFRLFSKFQDKRDQGKQEKQPRNNRFIERAIESAPYSHGEALSLGARVLVTLNGRSGDGRAYVNGDTGVLVGGTTTDGRSLDRAIAQWDTDDRRFTIQSLVVSLDRLNGAEVVVNRGEHEVKDPTGRYPNYSVSGLPVRLGYACTIHRAQGMTVPKAWVDMASLGKFPDKESIHGLAYVALSRTRTLDGLLIGSWSPEFVYCNQALAPLL